MHALTDDEAQAAIASGVLRRGREAGRGRLPRARADAATWSSARAPTSPGATPALDFDLNAGLANELGCPVLVVVGGRVRATRPASAARIAARVARAARAASCSGVIVNRVPVRRSWPEVARSLARRDVESGPCTCCPSSRSWPTPPSPRSWRAERRSRRDDRGRLRAGAADARTREVSADVRAWRRDERRALHRRPRRRDARDRARRPAGHPRREPRRRRSRSAFPAVAGIVLITAGYELDPGVRRLLEAAPFPVLEVPQRDLRGGHGGRAPSRPPMTAGRRAQDRRRARPASSRGVDADELEERIDARAARAHDADHVRVRADRAGAGELAAHRPAGGRRRARAARRRDPAAPRRRGADASWRRRRGARPRGGARPRPERARASSTPPPRRSGSEYAAHLPRAAQAQGRHRGARLRHGRAT